MTRARKWSSLLLTLVASDLVSSQIDHQGIHDQVREVHHTLASAICHIHCISPMCGAYGVVRVCLSRRMKHDGHPSRTAAALQYSDHTSGQWG